jgi:hypothetical protein
LQGPFIHPAGLIFAGGETWLMPVSKNTAGQTTEFNRIIGQISGKGGERRMGAWGQGNFDNDTAADHLSTLMARLVGEVEQAMADPSQLEPDEYWGCAVPCTVEILTLLSSRQWVGATLPAPAAIGRWRDTYMQVWEDHIDDLEPTADYKQQRRAMLEKTFADLLVQARRHAGDGPD